jgi:hypothetical protein
MWNSIVVSLGKSRLAEPIFVGPDGPRLDPDQVLPRVRRYGAASVFRFDWRQCRTWSVPRAFAQRPMAMTNAASGGARRAFLQY